MLFFIFNTTAMTDSDTSPRNLFDINFNAFDVKTASLFSDLSTEYESKLTAECPDIYKMEHTLWSTVKELADASDDNSRKILREFFGLSDYFIELLKIKSTTEIGKLSDRYMLSYALNPELQRKILEDDVNLYAALSDAEQLRFNAYWLQMANIVRICAPDVRSLRSGLSEEFCAFLAAIDTETELRLRNIPLNLYSLHLRCSEDLIAGILCAKEIAEELYVKERNIDPAKIDSTDLSVIDRNALRLREAYRSLKFLQITSALHPERKLEFSQIDYDEMLRQIPLSKIEAILNTQL